ncbi:MAG: alpha-D-glucose phosphate-specific phosphoglucomutase, partial [Proteobacteria bacterium]
HAILNYNLGRTSGLADGVVITPSHNPPQDGGFKYNPTHGGPAGKDITDWIEKTANQHLESKLTSVLRIPYERALKAASVHRFDFVNTYVKDLDSILDFDVIRHSDIKLAVDPLGGAGVDYWQPIADRYKINLQVLNKSVDPTFKFMARDWDGKIRMDPSSQYVMSPLLEQRKNFDVAFACDTDHDRHGIVTKSAGLMQANHYLATCIAYLYRHRPQWPTTLKIGKTLVSSQIIDRVAKMIEREVYEVPVGFKWFVDGLTEGTLGFVGEESAGSTFLRKDGRVWTTDKDSFVPSLLAGEMTARLGKDPGELYKDLTEQLGSPVYARVDSPASAEEKKRVTSLDASKLMGQSLGGDKITAASNKAKSNGAAIGGFKLETENGWVAARPSGTEDILKIYGESFKGNDHLQSLFSDVKKIVAG